MVTNQVSDTHIQDTETYASRRGRIPFVNWLINGMLLASSILMLFPFVWMILGAFKPGSELQRPVPSFFPEAPTFSNFTKIFELFPFGRFILNSILITVITVLIILFTSSLLGYIFAKIDFPGSKIIFLIILSSMIVPFEVRVVPMFLVVKQFDWQNSYQALIIPFVIDAFGIYLFKEFIHTIPKDYIDAARIDGASEWSIYTRVILPLTQPVLSALAIFSYVYIWDQLIWPLVVVSSDVMKTLPLGMVLFSNQRGAIYNLVFAAGIISVVPPLIVFSIFQKKIVKGMVLAGIKG